MGDRLLRLVLKEKGPRLETFNLLNLFLKNVSFILPIICPDFGVLYPLKDPADHDSLVSVIIEKCQSSPLLLMAEGPRTMSSIRIGFHGQGSCPVSGFTSDFKDESNCEAEKGVRSLIQLLSLVLFTVDALWPRLTHGISR